MKGKLVCVGAPILALVLIGCKSDSGTESVATQARTLSGDFTKISNEGVAGIYIRSGSPISVNVQADADAMGHVTTKVENGTLIVKTDDNYQPKKKIRIAVVLPHLVDIAVDGSGNVNFQNLDHDPLNISLKGSGSVNGDGTAKSLTADINGSGDINFPGLNVPSVKVSIEGSGNVVVWPARSLDVNINGSGNVTYKGSPEIHRKINGSGEIKPFHFG